MKTLVYSTHPFDQPFLEKAAKGLHELVFTPEPLTEITATMANGFSAIAIFTSDLANDKVLTILHQQGVRFIALRSVGHDHIQLHKAKSLGIKVANVPAYSPHAIAEHATALLLALNRRLIKSQNLMRKNDFRLDELVGFDLNGKTVGIIGTGKIGTCFANIMHGFGCQLVAYDVIENKVLQQKANLKYMSLNEVCAKADIISICCPLNDNTKYLVNESLFKQMKKGVYIINTARGSIINTADLLTAIDEGIVGGAGLDVYEFEKPIYFYNHKDTVLKDELFEKLRSHPKVLLTGHQAFLTNEALKGIAETTINNLSDWEQQSKSQNDLN